MSELNLPEEFRELEKATKNWPVYSQALYIPNNIERLLTALSEARDEIDKMQLEKDAVDQYCRAQDARLKDMIIEIDTLKARKG